jgi:hypothetical protein
VSHLVTDLPVEDVEEPVEAEGCHVVGGDVFDQSDFIEHHYLRDEGHCLQPQTVAPHELPAGPAAIDYQGHHESSRQQHHEVREVVSDGIVGLKYI